MAEAHRKTKPGPRFSTKMGVAEMRYHLKGQVLALSLLALAPLCAKAALAQDTLSVMSFGGAYQEAQRKAVFETYAAGTGIKVDEQEYGGEIAKIKAMIESGNTTIDVVDVDAPTLLQGCDEGIFEKIDWSAIGSKDDWIEGTTSDCGVGTIVYATTLAFDGAKLSDGPSTIKDLFDTKKFPGKRGLWKNPATNLEFALLADGVPPAEVYETLSTPEGVDRAFAKLDTIKDSIVWWRSRHDDGVERPHLQRQQGRQGFSHRLGQPDPRLQLLGDPEGCQEPCRLACLHQICGRTEGAGRHHEIHSLRAGAEVLRRIRRT
jgi:spermidine/putrescine-binding protein